MNITEFVKRPTNNKIIISILSLTVIILFMTNLMNVYNAFYVKSLVSTNSGQDIFLMILTLLFIQSFDNTLSQSTKKLLQAGASITLIISMFLFLTN